MTVFRLDIEGVFRLTGRGTAVSGPYEGDIDSGARVVVKDGDDVVATATAWVELTDPPPAPDGRRRLALLLNSYEGDPPEPGQVVEPA